MTISSLQWREQITATSVEITDADFNRIEVMGHTEIVDAACPEATLARTSRNACGISGGAWMDLSPRSEPF